MKTEYSKQELAWRDEHGKPVDNRIKTLQDRVDSAIAAVKSLLLDYLKENEPDELPDPGNDLDYSGSVHEIVDGSIPIYTHEIKSAWFLHGAELESAYEGAGAGDNPMENDGMAAIYYYIHQEVCEWYGKEAQDVFDAWKEEHDANLATEDAK